MSKRPGKRTSSVGEVRTRRGDALIAYLERRARRAARRQLGLDRFGRPLQRAAGTNPRARGTNPRALGTNPRALRAVDDVVDDGRTLGEVQLGRRLGWAA